jgi:putative FmdB family regulatory protein
MPFYEYECQACKYYAEVMQKISDAPLTRCPSCGKRAMKKLLSVPVFRLKGSGWYETDFKSDKENRRNIHGAEKEEARAESKTEAKEAKPAAAEAKESKEAKPAAAKPSTGAAAEAGASRSHTTPARTSARRRPARAVSKGRARKPRR